MLKKISVIIISYNSEQFISRCIDSVLKYLPKNGEVIVFDNASSDKTVDILKEFAGQITLLESKENLGFSKGNNQAVRKSNGEYLFFLNPDTRLTEPVFEELINFYESHENAGVVGPKLKLADGKTQETVRQLPTVQGAILEYVFGIKNAYSQYVPDSEEPVLVESIYGAALLIKRDLFERVKGFDERFFLYYEDTDLCLKVSRLLKKIFYYPKLSIEHLVGATKSRRNKTDLNYQSAKIYHGWFKLMVLQAIFIIPRLRRRLGLR